MLTRTLSPRTDVRVAAVDDAGRVQNVYPRTHPIDAATPTVPWAVYLADAQRKYRLLAFDFDAKGNPAAAHADAARMCELLTGAGLPHVVCESGPSGGRHVWVGLAEGIEAEPVAQLGRLAKPLMPTLDLAPISNPATGCVRPPLSPHRNGGYSTVLRGDLSALTAPTGTEVHVHALIELLAREVNTRAATAAAAVPADVAHDARKHPYVPGRKGPLGRAAAAALTCDPAGRDTSALLWRVLTGAADAHWRFEDVTRLIDAPGLEHARSYADEGGRIARSAADTWRVLARQWQRAVAHVAAGKRAAGSDPAFAARAEARAAHIRSVQTRADACCGRWASGGGPTDRRVLDALCLLSLRAVNVTVEADIRRLALMTGIGRETARVALQRLAQDGWITRACAADGPRAAFWTIEGAAPIHRETGTARSQVPHAPAAAALAERNALLLLLADRLDAAAHDAFTPRALGFQAGNVYSRIPTGGCSVRDLAASTGTPADVLAPVLLRLASANLIRRTHTGWERTDASAREHTAEHAGTAGILAARAERYAVERELWAWWQAELEWMCTPRRERTRRAEPDQLTLTFRPLLPRRTRKHPRNRGRADFRAARRYLVTETAP